MTKLEMILVSVHSTIVFAQKRTRPPNGCEGGGGKVKGLRPFGRTPLKVNLIKPRRLDVDARDFAKHS
jgi:hypothetical protein